MSAAPAAREYTARLIECREAGAGVKLLRLSAPEDFSFIPGQWVLLDFPDKTVKGSAYSMASSPLQKGSFELSVAAVGAFSERLFAAPEGQELLVKGPNGKWVYDDALPHAVLITDGSGIAPYRAFGRYVLDKNAGNKLSILYSARAPELLLFNEDLERFAAAGHTVYRTVTRNEQPRGWGGPFGVIDGTLIEQVVTGWKTATYYVCGPKTLVDRVRADLLSRGLSSTQIRAEAWGDYPC